MEASLKMPSIKVSEFHPMVQASLNEPFISVEEAVNMEAVLRDACLDIVVQNPDTKIAHAKPIIDIYTPAGPRIDFEIL